MERRYANWLVYIYILNKISAIFGKNRVGLYRDDGLALVKEIQLGTLIWQGNR